MKKLTATIVCLSFATHLYSSPENKPNYEFNGGYPSIETVQNVYDDIDINRAVQAYKFFYPTVSIKGTFEGNIKAGLVPNKVFGILEGTPNQLVFTPNSDTPYAGIMLDLTKGPFVIELPPGPLMCAANDLNQEWVMDMGLPGPDAGKGGKHLLLPVGYKGETPSGYQVGKPTTNKILVLLRAIPKNGDMKGAVDFIKTAKFYPLNEPDKAKDISWINLNKNADFTPLTWEKNIRYWEELYDVVNSEPANPKYQQYYGELAALGIIKGKPFKPDARMKKILEKAAVMANAQMRVQSFADRRQDRIVWKDRNWEWATLRPEGGTFDLPNYRDLEAREKWFFQAQIESPAMFRRTAGAGSLYWLSARDKEGNFLDGSKSYRLKIPLPVPQKLFWSVTIYDAETRSEIKTDQSKAALRSLFELTNEKIGANKKEVILYFGPNAPKDQQAFWIKTIPNKGWFTYLRLYGPEKPAFDGSWKPSDFEMIESKMKQAQEAKE